MIWENSWRLEDSLRLFQYQGVLGGDIRRQGRIFYQNFPVDARPVVFNEAVSGKRVRLVFYDVRTRRRIRCRFMCFFQATIKFVRLIRCGCEFRASLWYLLRCRTYLQRQTFRYICRWSASVDRVRCAFCFTARINISQDVGGVSFYSFMIG